MNIKIAGNPPLTVAYSDGEVWIMQELSTMFITLEQAKLLRDALDEIIAEF